MRKNDVVDLILFYIILIYLLKISKDVFVSALGNNVFSYSILLCCGVLIIQFLTILGFTFSKYYWFVYIFKSKKISYIKVLFNQPQYKVNNTCRVLVNLQKTQLLTLKGSIGSFIINQSISFKSKAMLVHDSFVSVFLKKSNKKFSVIKYPYTCGILDIFSSQYIVLKSLSITLFYNHVKFCSNSSCYLKVQER